MWPESLRESALAAFTEQRLLEQAILQEPVDVAQRWITCRRKHLSKRPWSGSPGVTPRLGALRWWPVTPAARGLGIDFYLAVDALARRDHGEAARLF